MLADHEAPAGADPSLPICNASGSRSGQDVTVHRLCQRVCVLVASTVGLLLSSALAAAQEPPPTVRIELAADPQTFANYCVDPPEMTHTPGSVELVRTGDASESLDVQYEVSGPEGESTGSVIFEAGSPTVVVDVAGQQPPGEIEWSLVEDEAYDLGEPSSVTLRVAFATTTCLAPSTTTSTLVDLPRTGSDRSTASLLFASVLSILLGAALVLLVGRRA